MGSNISNAVPIMLEARYIKELSVSERSDFEKRVFKVFAGLGFNISTSSRIGVSILANSTIIEQTFRTKIEVRAVEDKGGTFGKERGAMLTFKYPPVIPEALAPYIKSVNFSLPVIPL
ncbi:MAG: hypothetical protein GTO13_03930 [Proteobacteria bacterium]|nr:hypothetical protein [Pseudomonadota bacterium]